MVSLRYLGTHSCGAALITDLKAVTAAQCVGNPLSTYEIIVGSANRLCAGGINEECARRSLAATVRHPNFVDMGSQGYPNDIAVITFSQQVIILPTNPNLQTIQLADASTALTNVAIMGWGRTSAYGDLPTILQFVVPIGTITELECQVKWTTSVIDYTRQICVYDYGVEVKRGPCYGDAGSPLVVGAGTLLNPYKLYGLMSWSAIECGADQPSVYTRVSTYADWINSQ